MIWKVEFTIHMLNERAKNTMSDFLQIEFIEVGDDYLIAKMPINERTKQPVGIMHGGASVALAESVGSTAANLCVDQKAFYCVGLDINTNHMRAVRDGFVIAKTFPYHIGKTTQVWSIETKTEDDKRVAVSRLTMAVIARAKVT